MCGGCARGLRIPGRAPVACDTQGIRARQRSKRRKDRIKLDSIRRPAPCSALSACVNGSGLRLLGWRVAHDARLPSQRRPGSLAAAHQLLCNCASLQRLATTARGRVFCNFFTLPYDCGHSTPPSDKPHHHPRLVSTRQSRGPAASRSHSVTSDVRARQRVHHRIPHSRPRLRALSSLHRAQHEGEPLRRHLQPRARVTPAHVLMPSFSSAGP